MPLEDEVEVQPGLWGMQGSLSGPGFQCQIEGYDRPSSKGAGQGGRTPALPVVMSSSSCWSPDFSICKMGLMITNPHLFQVCGEDFLNE